MISTSYRTHSFPCNHLPCKSALSPQSLTQFEKTFIFMRQQKEKEEDNPMKIKKQTDIASPVQDFLEQLYRNCAAATNGEVATYIPELAKANPDWFGICLVTANGAIYE